MKTVFLSLVFLSLIVLQPPSVTFAASEKERDRTATEEVRFDLSFPGGSFLDLIRLIHEVTGKPPNVIVGPGARETRLPPFELYSVSADQVFNAIIGLAMSRESELSGMTIILRDGIWIIDRAIRRDVPSPGVRPGGGREGMTTDPFAPSPGKPEQITHIFQIRQLLAKFELEDITTAIETAWELAGYEEASRTLRFHHETKLLFVRGSRDQIRLVEQVLKELRPPPEPSELREARAELEGLLTRYRERHPAVIEQQARIQELERAAGFVTPRRERTDEEGGVREPDTKSH